MASQWGRCLAILALNVVTYSDLILYVSCVGLTNTGPLV